MNQKNMVQRIKLATYHINVLNVNPRARAGYYLVFLKNKLFLMDFVKQNYDAMTNMP